MQHTPEQAEKLTNFLATYGFNRCLAWLKAAADKFEDKKRRGLTQQKQPLASFTSLNRILRGLSEYDLERLLALCMSRLNTMKSTPDKEMR